MAEYFNKMAEEIHLATEELQALFTGSGASGSDSGGNTNSFDASGNSGSYAHEFDLDGMDLGGMSEEEVQRMLAEELMQNNPLQGIAEGVTKDILAGQVRSVRRVESSRIESIRFQNKQKRQSNPKQTGFKCIEYNNRLFATTPSGITWKAQIHSPSRV